MHVKCYIDVLKTGVMWASYADRHKQYVAGTGSRMLSSRGLK